MKISKRKKNQTRKKSTFFTVGFCCTAVNANQFVFGDKKKKQQNKLNRIIHTLIKKKRKKRSLCPNIVISGGHFSPSNLSHSIQAW